MQQNKHITKGRGKPLPYCIGQIIHIRHFLALLK